MNGIAIMSTLPNNCPALCACGVSYNIGTNITQEPYFSGSGYTTTPTAITSSITNEAACVIGATNDGITLAFQGTIFNSVLSWLTDAIVEPMEANGFPGKVHTGFYLSVMAIINQIEAELKTLLNGSTTTQVLITGHSKGGALASIAAWYLSQVSKTLHPSQISVVTFASPLAGNGDFAAGYKKLFNQGNYFNYLDIVPFVPPGSVSAGAWSATFAAAAAIAAKLGLEDLAAVLLKVSGLMVDAAEWDYTSASSIDYFIKSDGTVSTNSWLYEEFYLAVTEHLVTGQFEKVLNAHSHECGGGYMGAVCAGLCK